MEVDFGIEYYLKLQNLKYGTYLSMEDISAIVPASLRAHVMECPRALRAVPWGREVGRFSRDHHRPGSRRLHVTPPPKNASKFCLTFLSILATILMDFGANLASKTDPKTTQNRSKIVTMFELIFEPSLDRCCIDFGNQVGPQIHPKLIENSIQKAIPSVVDFGIDL